MIFGIADAASCRVCDEEVLELHDFFKAMLICDAVYDDGFCLASGAPLRLVTSFKIMMSAAE